jgi:hypothetical protein
MYLVLFSHVRDKAFPVPDPNRATDRTGNCIAADAIGDANEKRLERRVLQRWVQLVEHLSSPRVCIGIRVTRSFFLFICFVDLCLSILITFLVSSNSSCFNNFHSV